MLESKEETISLRVLTYIHRPVYTHHSNILTVCYMNKITVFHRCRVRVIPKKYGYRVGEDSSHIASTYTLKYPRRVRVMSVGSQNKDLSSVLKVVIGFVVIGLAIGFPISLVR